MITSFVRSFADSLRLPVLLRLLVFPVACLPVARVSLLDCL
jgi:hypothetical protein